MEVPNSELKELYEIFNKKYEKKFIEKNWHAICEAYLIAKGKYSESMAEKSKRTGYNLKVVEGLNDKMIQDEIRKIRKVIIEENLSKEQEGKIIKEFDELERIAFVKAV